MNKPLISLKLIFYGQTKVLFLDIIFFLLICFQRYDLYQKVQYLLYFFQYRYHNQRLIIMSQRQVEESGKQAQKKNQKNIYVHKINSLIKISQQNLLQDEREINSALNKKKIKKVRSQIDKNALKLEKNRESAKRARLRKKLYIKLLQNQVDHLKQVAREGERIQKDAQKFLKMISRKQEASQSMLDEVQRYLSRDNLGDLKRNEQDREDVPTRMDKLIEQICQISMCSPLRNIRELSSQISLEQILKSEDPQQRQIQGEQLQDIIKEVLLESQQLRQIYTQIVRENENMKKYIQDNETKREGFPEDFNIYTDHIEIKPQSQKIRREQFVSYLKPPAERSNILINLSEAERILIQANSFLELDGNFQES